jgi:FAD/FMN-containing dehydrogenase
VNGVDRRSFVLGTIGLVVARGARQTTPAQQLKRLAATLQGTVVFPTSPGYDAARVEYDERYDAVHPLGIAQPASIADVRKLVDWSRTTGISLAARSGGHSYGGYSTTTGVVVDLARFSTVRYSQADGTATVGAGVRVAQLFTSLGASGVAVPTGSCGTVGLGGLTLGGGVGFASRRFGTTSDNVVSLGLVTADGRYRRCSGAADPDLFWACRGGGGGNFGIVTDFVFRAHPVGDVTVFHIGFPWSALPEVLAAWQQLAPHAPDGLFSVCSMSGTPSVVVAGQFFGGADALRSLVAPLTGIAGASLGLETIPYVNAQRGWAGGTGRALFVAKSDYLAKPLPETAAATIASWLERVAGLGFGSGSLLLDSYGGAINRVAPGATAFVHRTMLGSFQYLAYYRSGTAAKAQTWLEGFHAAMGPYVSGYAYQNYIDPSLPGWEHAYYGSNYPRLQRVKRAVDPDGVFRFRQSIRP